MNFINILVVVIFLHLCVVRAALDVGDKCQVKNGPGGICRSLADCPEAIANIRKGIHPQKCRFQGTQVIVCCPEPEAPEPESPVVTEVTKVVEVTKPTKLARTPGVISEQKCQEYTKYIRKIETDLDVTLKAKCQLLVFQHIAGGQPAERGEFPHLVQFGYEYRGIFWTCGGSLISEQYVLTAAHCLTDNTLGSARYARMGIVNLEDKNHIQQYNISELIPYPDYDGGVSFYHDIGLAKLGTKAELNNWVRPACLYTKTSPPSPSSATIAAGWGKTSYQGSQSKVLLKVLLLLYDQPRCNKHYVGTQRLGQGIQDQTMVCAGSPTKIGDTCEGDSGGPLEIYREAGDNDPLSCMHDVVGITAFGKPCNIQGDVPSVYTRVSFYVKWIEDIVWPLKTVTKRNSYSDW